MSHYTPDEPEIPEYIAYLWDWFWELSSRRRSGFSGGEPIGYADIGYWIALTGADPTPNEVGVIVAMDAAYATAIADEQAAKKESQQKS